MSYNNIKETVRIRQRILINDVMVSIFSWMKLSFMLNVNKKIPVRR